MGANIVGEKAGIKREKVRQVDIYCFIGMTNKNGNGADRRRKTASLIKVETLATTPAKATVKITSYFWEG
jgi:hypothetical protein